MNLIKKEALQTVDKELIKRLTEIEQEKCKAVFQQSVPTLSKSSSTEDL